MAASGVMPLTLPYHSDHGWNMSVPGMPSPARTRWLRTSGSIEYAIAWRTRGSAAGRPGALLSCPTIDMLVVST